MSREMNIEEAASWSDDDTTANIEWLELYSRWTDIRRVRVLRGEIEEESPAAEPQPAATTSDEEPDFAEASIAEVRKWVGDDKDRAAKALEEERTFEKPRKGLVEPLEDMLTAP